MIRYLIAGVAAIALIGCAQPEAKFADWPAATETPFTEVTGELVRHAQVPTQYAVPRDIDIWLPPSYRTTDARYPVIYVNDGHQLFDPSLSFISGAEWKMDETMTRLIAEGKVPEAIIVGIHATDRRYEEYMMQGAVTPLTDEIRERVSTRPMPFEWAEMNGDGYQRFIVEELKPFVDQTYRTKPGRDNTTVMGISTGGIAVLNSVMLYPDVFSASAGMSTHIATGQGLVPEYIKGRVPNPARVRVYTDHGDQGLDLDWDYAKYATQLDAHFRAAGHTDATYDSRIFPGTGHSETFWADRLEVPLRFLLNGESIEGGVRK